MSGLFNSFRVPTLVKRPRKSHGLPCFDWGLLSFGTVYLANYGVDSRKVVVKKLKGESMESKRRFFKEAEMLNRINVHENIPTFLGYSDNPHGLMMEFAAFDFSPFDTEKVVSNLEDFYHFVAYEFDFNAFADI